MCTHFILLSQSLTRNINMTFSTTSIWRDPLWVNNLLGRCSKLSPQVPAKYTLLNNQINFPHYERQLPADICSLSYR